MMKTGALESFDGRTGSIRGDDGTQYRVRASDIAGQERCRLTEGARVEFHALAVAQGWKATNVRRESHRNIAGDDARESSDTVPLGSETSHECAIAQDRPSTAASVPLARESSDTVPLGSETSHECAVAQDRPSTAASVPLDPLTACQIQFDTLLATQPTQAEATGILDSASRYAQHLVYFLFYAFLRIFRHYRGTRNYPEALCDQLAGCKREQDALRRVAQLDKLTFGTAVRSTDMVAKLLETLTVPDSVQRALDWWRSWSWLFTQASDARNKPSHDVIAAGATQKRWARLAKGYRKALPALDGFGWRLVLQSASEEAESHATLSELRPVGLTIDDACTIDLFPLVLLEKGSNTVSLLAGKGDRDALCWRSIDANGQTRILEGSSRLVAAFYEDFPLKRWEREAKLQYDPRAVVYREAGWDFADLAQDLGGHFVGRHAFVDRVVQWALKPEDAAVRTDSAKVMWIEGDTGIGKSALMWNVAATLARGRETCCVIPYFFRFQDRRCSLHDWVGAALYHSCAGLRHHGATRLRDAAAPCGYSSGRCLRCETRCHKTAHCVSP